MLIKILLSCAILFLIDRFLLWIEKKGWLFYRKRKSSGGFIGNALLELNSVFQPSSRHVIEVKQKAGNIKRCEADSEEIK